MACWTIQLLFIFIAFIEPGICGDGRRPVYIIGHATNSIEDVKRHLDDGSNALESDVHFFPNGSVKELLHGCDAFHDCFVPCGKHVQMPEYFKYLRDLTDPSREDSYYDKLIVQMLDLKLETSNDYSASGHDIARHVIDYLWSEGDRPQEIRIVFYFYKPDQKTAVEGFIQEFKDRGQESRLKDVGFDGGSAELSDVKKVVDELNLENNWIGDGILNCVNPFYPKIRLKKALDVRNSGGFIKKVYDWTVDVKFSMRTAFDLGVDGFITNLPKNVIEVLNEDKYKQKFRPAVKSDPPFERFEG